MSGVLYVVATPIGNLEDLSPRAARILAEADIVAAEDTRSARHLLDSRGVRANSLRSYFVGNEAARTDELIAAMEAGQSVALISEAGTPAVSDPGQRLIAAAAGSGLRVEVVPGPSAAIAALVASGLPTSEFRFIGFPPREDGARRQRFGQLRGELATIIVYEAPDRVAATLDDLCAAFGGERRASLSREITKRFEEHVRGSLADLRDRFRDKPPRGECTLVIEGGEGDLVEMDIEAAMREALKAGLGPKDAAARLVVKTGKKRRELYQLALSIRRSMNGNGD